MIYYAQGTALLSSEEMFEPSVLNAVAEFHSEIAIGATPVPLELAGGDLTSENILTEFTDDVTGNTASFQKIGLGLPLTIMIRQVYTGKAPKGGGLFGGGNKDMLLTSAIKSIAHFDAKPRALNYLMDKVAPKSHITRPPAMKDGTPIIFYSPALLERSMTLDLSMVFDNFPQEAFDQVGNALTSAGGIPVFAVASAYLLAAGMITKVLGKVGEAIFDGEPTFNSSDAIDIALPGSPPIPPGFLLITPPNVDDIEKDFLKKYHVNDLGKVVDSANTEYQGDISFVVISLDGTPDEEFAKFSPTAASAAIISRFYGLKDGQNQPLDLVVDAIKVYSDLTYRKQVDRIDEQLNKLPAGDPKRAALEEKRKALVENILNEILKPK